MNEITGGGANAGGEGRPLAAGRHYVGGALNSGGGDAVEAIQTSFLADIKPRHWPAGAE